MMNLSTIKNFKKTKIESHGDEVTDFYNKEIPNIDSNHTCLSVISVDSTLKKDKNYYQLLIYTTCYLFTSYLFMLLVIYLY